MVSTYVECRGESDKIKWAKNFNDVCGLKRSGEIGLDSFDCTSMVYDLNIRYLNGHNCSVDCLWERQYCIKVPIRITDTGSSPATTH